MFFNYQMLYWFRIQSLKVNVQMEFNKASYHLQSQKFQIICLNIYKLIIKPSISNACFRCILNTESLTTGNSFYNPKTANGCKRKFSFPKVLFQQETQNKKEKNPSIWKMRNFRSKIKVLLISSTNIVLWSIFLLFHVLKLSSTMSEGFFIETFFSRGFLLGFIHGFWSPFWKEEEN